MIKGTSNKELVLLEDPVAVVVCATVREEKKNLREEHLYDNPIKFKFK
jgi:hypothetical protein